MIAQPDSTAGHTAQGEVGVGVGVGVEESPLTADELYRLTLYKWRYSLEAYGFDALEVRELMFLKWLHASRRVQP